MLGGGACVRVVCDHLLPGFHAGIDWIIKLDPMSLYALPNNNHFTECTVCFLCDSCVCVHMGVSLCMYVCGSVWS